MSRLRRIVPVAAAALLAGPLLAFTPATSPDENTPPPSTDPVALQLLALNDFHGNLEPPTGSSGVIDGVPAGGVEYLATTLALLADQVQDENTITVAAGDLIGASPLLSAAFHDEPTIE